MGLTPMQNLTDIFFADGCRLVYRFDFEQLWIEPWGTDSLRVRSAVGKGTTVTMEKRVAQRYRHDS